MSNNDDDTYTIEKICDRRVHNGRVEYYIKWLNYPPEENTWEPAKNLSCKELLAEYNAEHKQAQSANTKRASLRSAATNTSSNRNDNSSKRASTSCTEEPNKMASTSCAEEPNKRASTSCAEKPSKRASTGCAEEPNKSTSTSCGEEPSKLATTSANKSNKRASTSCTEKANKRASTCADKPTKRASTSVTDEPNKSASTSTHKQNKRSRTTAEKYLDVFSSEPLTPETVARNKFFEPEHEAQRILGVCHIEGTNYFLIEFKGMEEAEWVLSNVANIHIPQMVIKFYEQRLYWSLP